MSDIEFNINWKLILDVLNPNACSSLDSLDQMLEKAFLELPISEKLMIRPFFELLGLKHSLTKGEPSEDVDIDLIKRQIHARLAVLNENGDFLSLLKKFSHLMESLGSKRSMKQLAKKGAQMLMDYVGDLKNLGDLH
jgi:hypothetical protein